MTFFEYLLGSVVYKIELFPKLRSLWDKIPKTLRIIGSVVIFVSLLLGHTLVFPSLFIAPVTGFIIIALFTLWRKPKFIENTFLFIGKHSTNIWLTHMFFYFAIFKNFVYIVKYPILIYLFMIAITVAVSMVLQFIEKPIVKRLPR